jgi:oligopeptide transport system permease protein
MLKFIGYRLLQFPLVLAIIYLLTFTLAWVVPGSPFEDERKLDEEVKRRLQEEFHAGNWASFVTHYPWRLVRYGDFGPSMRYRGWSVNDILKTALPVSVSLGMLALVIAIGAGVTLGTLAAVKRGGLFDWLSLSVALVGISLPSFVAAAMLLIVFTLWVPICRVGAWGSLRDMLIPAIALSLVPMAYIARLMRVAMIDVLGQDYVRTARAKGLSSAMVIWKHCLRNAFLPVLSYLGPAAAAAFTGSFVVEKVFDIPGLGQHFVNSVRNRDQTLILGTVIVYSLFLLTFNLLVDVAYALVDPRIEVTNREDA